jgi:hypothetical protein
MGIISILFVGIKMDICRAKSRFCGLRSSPLKRLKGTKKAALLVIAAGYNRPVFLNQGA